MLQDMNSVDALAIQIKAANVRAVSRAITLLEDRQSDGLAILHALEPLSRRAAIIGVTGYPGAGTTSASGCRWPCETRHSRPERGGMLRR